nr:MAG TPA: hypothetical protein [Caudoviricetes sp.]
MAELCYTIFISKLNNSRRKKSHFLIYSIVIMIIYLTFLKLSRTN